MGIELNNIPGRVNIPIQINDIPQHLRSLDTPVPPKQNNPLQATVGAKYGKYQVVDVKLFCIEHNIPLHKIRDVYKADWIQVKELRGILEAEGYVLDIYLF